MLWAQREFSEGTAQVERAAQVIGIVGMCRLMSSCLPNFEIQSEYRSRCVERSEPHAEECTRSGAHESALRRCVDLVSLNVCQHCSCTSVHILSTPANVVTSALAQVFSKTVIHGIESQHSFNFSRNRTRRTWSTLDVGVWKFHLISRKFHTGCRTRRDR